MNILELQSITKFFGGVVAISDLSFSVGTGEILGVIGPNGSGKTTLLNLINGFCKPDKGHIFFRGREIINSAPYSNALRGIGRLFQHPRLFRQLTLLENLSIAQHDVLEETLYESLLRRGYQRSRVAEQIDKAHYWLEYVGLNLDANNPAGTLSYGQEKLLAMAMVLARGCKLLLIDEPVSGIDAQMSAKILSLFEKLRETGITFVIVEHALDFLFATSNRIILLSNGRKIYDGGPDQIKHDNSLLREMYLNNHAAL